MWLLAVIANDLKGLGRPRHPALTHVPEARITYRVSVLRRLVFVLASLVLGWHGMGAPMDLAGSACACDEMTDGPESPLAGNGLEEHGAHETCPPNCEDDCPCCSSATMVAGVPSVWIRPPAASPLGPRVDCSHGTPSGEHDGVYRPPRV